MSRESISSKLSEIFELYKSGALSIDEYEKLKQQVLSGDGAFDIKNEKYPNQEITKSPIKPNQTKKRSRILILAILCIASIFVVFHLVRNTKSSIASEKNDPNKDSNIETPINYPVSKSEKYKTLQWSVAKSVADSVLTEMFDKHYFEALGSHPDYCSLISDSILINGLNNDNLPDALVHYWGENSELYGNSSYAGWILILNEGNELEVVTHPLLYMDAFDRFSKDTIIGEKLVFDGAFCCPSSGREVKYKFRNGSFALVSEKITWIDPSYSDEFGGSVPTFTDDNISLTTTSSIRKQFLDSENQNQYSSYSKHKYTLNFNSPYLDESRIFEPIYIENGIQRAYFINSEYVCIQRQIRNGRVAEEIHFHPNGKIFTIVNFENGKESGFTKYVDLDNYVILEGELKNGKMIGFWDTPVLGNFNTQDINIINQYPGIVNQMLTLINFYRYDKDARIFAMN